MCINRLVLQMFVAMSSLMCCGFCHAQSFSSETSLAMNPDAVTRPYVTLDRLPLLPQAGSLHQFSSRNKRGLNGDAGWYLYVDEHGDKVIFEAVGPGCIRSIWGTNFKVDPLLKFYFDGEETPRYEIPILDFYLGKHEHFPEPLVSYEERGHWGDNAYAGNCFVPIPFEKSLKISCSGDPAFYHFIYNRYPYGTKVTTFNGDEDRTYLQRSFDKMGENPWAEEEVKIEKAYSDTLQPGNTYDILNIEGAGCIRCININAEGTEDFLKNVYIRMKWDETSDHELGWFESQHYNVLCPVGFFFGTPLKAQNMKSLPLKVEIIDKGQLSLNSYFPMPFWHNAHISLHNRSQYPVYINGAEVSVSKIMYPETQTGYFCTAYREGMTAYDCDWLFLETPGTGWFIGAVQTGQN